MQNKGYTDAKSNMHKILSTRASILDYPNGLNAE